MPFSPPLLFAAVSMVVLSPLSVASAADSCFRNIGTKVAFGSEEQVQALQALAKSKCPIVGLTFKLAQPSRSTLIVADLEKGEMLRLKIDPVSRPWERWSGFTRDDIFKDDPSDGFDLGTFSPSRSSETPAISDRILAFLKANKMQAFLP